MENKYLQTCRPTCSCIVQCIFENKVALYQRRPELTDATKCVYDVLWVILQPAM